MEGTLTDRRAMRHARLYVIFLFIVILASCSGGGSSDGGSPAHIPEISGLWLSSAAAIQGDGGGQTQLNYRFSVRDAGGDVVSVTVTAQDSLGNQVGSLSGPLQGTAGVTQGYIDGGLTASTATPGVYTFDFCVGDGAGGVSNHLQARYTVTALVSIAVTPTNPAASAGLTQQFTATGTLPDGIARDLTRQVTWTSSNANTATIDSTGLATGTAVGTTTITATFGNLSGSTVLTVSPGFAPGVRYPLDNFAVGNTAIGDLNGDGRNDVAVLASDYPASRILIYHQNAQRTLDAPLMIATDFGARGLVIADVNNDGLADLIVSGNSITTPASGSISVFRQSPVTHSLGSPQYYPLSGGGVGPLAVADLNGDGLLDIVAASAGSGANGVVSFLFQGAGGVLGPEVVYSSVPVRVQGELHVADMNGDGLKDIVLQSGWLQLAVIKQTAPGAFGTNPDFYTVQTGYWSVFDSFALGDLNGDGRTDIAVADITDNLNIFLQNANGVLTGPTIRGGSSASEVDIADLDGDGLGDIVLLNSGRVVEIYLQEADHAFSARHTYRLPSNSSGGTSIHEALTIGDVTGDGVPDIVTSWSWSGISVLRGVR